MRWEPFIDGDKNLPRQDQAKKQIPGSSRSPQVDATAPISSPLHPAKLCPTLTASACVHHEQRIGGAQSTHSGVRLIGL